MALPALKQELNSDVSEEDARLAALARYDILDTPKEEAFERITTLMKLVLKTDVSLVSMIDGHRQWYKSNNGGTATEVPVGDSFCQFTVAGNEPVVVADATKDARFKDNPYVTGDSHVRFYAGVPLTTPDGYNIGTLCAFSREPREFKPEETQILQELAKVAMSELELRQLASSDGLTGVLTRRAFREDAAKYLAHAKRHRTRLSAVTFDIDHFKQINDTYGHAVGDKVLTAVSKAVGAELRQSDLLGRVGGEEFAALLPETDEAGALDVAEKLRAAIRALKFPGSHPVMGVTASFGIATFDQFSDDLQSLLVKADEALYEAKRSGRNRSMLWKGTTTSTTRQVTRRRVLKAGRLIFNNRHSVTDCTVRSIWENGAEVDVSSTVGIPEEVTLSIKSDNIETLCRVTVRRPTSLEFEFV